jgi:hypothetical protein
MTDRLRRLVEREMRARHPRDIPQREVPCDNVRDTERGGREREVPKGWGWVLRYAGLAQAHAAGQQGEEALEIGLLEVVLEVDNVDGEGDSHVADAIIQALKHVARQLAAYERLRQQELAAEKRGKAEERRDSDTVAVEYGLYSRLMDSVPEVLDPSLANLGGMWTMRSGGGGRCCVEMATEKQWRWKDVAWRWRVRSGGDGRTLRCDGE